MSEETTPSANVAGIIEAISGLTVLELAELVKALEAKFGVSAAAPMMMVGAAPAGGAAEAAPVKDTFDVILTSAGEKKIQVIKVVREITNLGLKEAKALVDEAPKPIKEGVSKQEADDIQARMVEAGATIEIK
jgi:large subunit ribosomal protein L7/L12